MQISNDISEGDCTANAKQLTEVVKYFRKECDKWISAYYQQRTDLLLFAVQQSKKSTP